MRKQRRGQKAIATIHSALEAKGVSLAELLGTAEEEGEEEEGEEEAEAEEEEEEEGREQTGDLNSNFARPGGPQAVS